MEAQRQPRKQPVISTIDIQSLGVIDEAHLEFGQGLTVLTGETGAGKTMILTSLQLLLGTRADPAWVRAGAEKAQVDGFFDISDDLIPLIEEHGGTTEDHELIVSRALATHGRSRAYLGGRAVPASILSDVIGRLVTIHGQADQLQLRSASTQRHTLDSCGSAEHQKLLHEYQQAWSAAVAAKQQLDTVREKTDDMGARQTYLKEVTTRIAELDPYEGEDEDLKLEAERLAHIEDLRTHITRAHTMLSGTTDTLGIIDILRDAAKEIQQAERLDTSLSPYRSQLEPLALELEAAGEGLERYLTQLEAHPQRLAEIHERRAALRSLMKGRASDVTELLRWQEQAVAELKALNSLENDPEVCAENLARAQQKVIECGSRLRRSRHTLAQELSQRITNELHGLAMPEAVFSITLEETKPQPHGTEDVRMLLQPHPSAPARPLGQGASGGELSRVMLAIEVVIGTREAARTYIFDEVDAGIGGHTAIEVGARLARLAQGRQVVVVTHLAQVAAYADTHLLVEKTAGTTTVRSLSGQERVSELVRMMGGDPHSETARRHASEILRHTVPE
nr:DNA repair protein RecN [Schaalia sp. lx-100]